MSIQTTVPQKKFQPLKSWADAEDDVEPLPTFTNTKVEAVNTKHEETDESSTPSLLQKVPVQEENNETPDKALYRKSQVQELSHFPPFKLYVGNLSFQLEEDELAEFFGLENVVHLYMPRSREKGQPRGFAYVEFATRESATAAMELQGQSLRNRALHIEIASEPKSRRKSDRYQRSDSDSRRSVNSSNSLPIQRKRLEILPRTNEPIKNDDTNAPKSIFGEAKPRDEKAFQERLKLREKEKEMERERMKSETKPQKKEKGNVKKKKSLKKETTENVTENTSEATEDLTVPSKTKARGGGMRGRVRGKVVKKKGLDHEPESEKGSDDLSMESDAKVLDTKEKQEQKNGNATRGHQGVDGKTWRSTMNSSAKAVNPFDLLGASESESD